MKHMNHSIISRIGFLLILLSILAVSNACWGQPLFDLIINNNTNQTLQVSVNGYKLGNVKPGEQITRENTPRDIGEYRIEARNTQGKIVFSQTFTWENLQEIERGKVYKAVIPPLQSN